MTRHICCVGCGSLLLDDFQDRLLCRALEQQCCNQRRAMVLLAGIPSVKYSLLSASTGSVPLALWQVQTGRAAM